MATKFIIAVITAEPSHADAVADALRAAVPLVREEPGCIQYDLHQDQLQPGRFVMIEQWSDAQALTAHSEASAFRALSAVLDGRATLDVIDLARVV
jgi:quinol monooxygenase YgiN